MGPLGGLRLRRTHREEQELNAALGSRFGVKTIPSLALVDAQGKTIASEAPVARALSCPLCAAMVSSRLSEGHPAFAQLRPNSCGATRPNATGILPKPVELYRCRARSAPNSWKLGCAGLGRKAKGPLFEHGRRP